jgi:hypothetical protein
MTTEFQREQQDRRQTALIDARVREQQQAATMSGFAQAEANIDRGRYTEHEKATVIGSTPIPHYPQGPAWCADPSGVEPPLGVDINEMQPTGEVFEVERSIAAQDAPTLEPRSPFGAQGNCGDPTAAPSAKSPGLTPKRVGSSPFTDEPPEAA